MLYVERGKDVSPEMRSGAEFAPMAFLNAELKRQDAKWRVGSVNGPRAEFFESVLILPPTRSPSSAGRGYRDGGSVVAGPSHLLQ